MNRRIPHYAAAQPADRRLYQRRRGGSRVSPQRVTARFDVDGSDVSISGCVVTTDMCSS